MTEKMIITINNGSNAISIGDGSCDFKLISHSGFDAADYSISTASGGAEDGSYITSARFDSRTLGISFDFGGRNGETIRQSLIRFFSPKDELLITARRGNVARQIIGRAADFHITESNRHAKSLVALSIFCPDPYFKIINAATLRATVITPLFHVPCAITAGTVISTRTSTGSFTFEVDGDEAPDVIFSFYFNDDCSNPYITNSTTSKTIAVPLEVAAGDTLTISTARGAKFAALNGAKCKVTPSSRFSDFCAIGSNAISYGSDDGSGSIDLSVTCTELYFGV